MRAIAIIGPRKSGKTRLASELACGHWAAGSDVAVITREPAQIAALFMTYREDCGIPAGAGKRFDLAAVRPVIPVTEVCEVLRTLEGLGTAVIVIDDLAALINAAGGSDERIAEVFEAAGVALEIVSAGARAVVPLVH